MFKNKLTLLLLGLLLAAISTFVVQQFNKTNNQEHFCGKGKVEPAGIHYIPYLPSNSGLVGKKVTATAAGTLGVWIGYGDSDGISFFDGTNWLHCKKGLSVTSIVVDLYQVPWVGTTGERESPSLLALNHFTKKWVNFSQYLPDKTVYDLMIGDQRLHACTAEGCATFDGTTWEVPYNNIIGGLFESQVTSIEFGRNGDQFFGTKGVGVTWFDLTEKSWQLMDSSETNISSAVHVLSDVNITEIVNHPSQPEIWIGSDQGITIFNYGEGTSTFLIPEVIVFDIGFDHHERPWVAGPAGTKLLLNEKWETISDLSSLTISFGCPGCRFDEKKALIGHEYHGFSILDVPPQ